MPTVFFLWYHNSFKREIEIFSRPYFLYPLNLDKIRMIKYLVGKHIVVLIDVIVTVYNCHEENMPALCEHTFTLAGASNRALIWLGDRLGAL